VKYICLSAELQNCNLHYIMQLLSTCPCQLCQWTQRRAAGQLWALSILRVAWLFSNPGTTRQTYLTNTMCFNMSQTKRSNCLIIFKSRFLSNFLSKNNSTLVWTSSFGNIPNMTSVWFLYWLYWYDTIVISTSLLLVWHGSRHHDSKTKHNQWVSPAVFL